MCILRNFSCTDRGSGAEIKEMEEEGMVRLRPLRGGDHKSFSGLYASSMYGSRLGWRDGSIIPTYTPYKLITSFPRIQIQ